MNSYIRYTCIGLMLGLTGCDGGNDDTQSPIIPPRPQQAQPPPPVSPYTYRSCTEASGAEASLAAPAALPGGIWYGSITNETRKETEPFDLVMTEDGRFRFLIDYDDFVGTLTTAGNVFMGDGVAYSGGSLWSDGSLKSDLTLGGTIAERDSMTGTWTLASGDAGCFESFYNADLYERSTTLGQIAGEWSIRDGWGLLLLTLTIDPDGRFTFYDPWDCSHSGHGQLALIDDRYNLLEIQDMAADCPASGTPFSGLAYVNSQPAGGTAGNVDVLVLAMGNDTQSFAIGFYKTE